MQPKFVAAQKNVVKTEPSKHFVNGLLGFTLYLYRWKHVVLLINCMSWVIDRQLICTAH